MTTLSSIPLQGLISGQQQIAQALTALSGGISTIAGGVTPAPGSVTYESFAPGINPIALVTSLPNPTGYVGPLVVMYLNDPSGTPQLYRYNSTVPDWEVYVPAVNVTGQLTDSQIQSIATAKLTGQITTTQITNNAITTPLINAGAVTTNQIAANTITASNIAAATITGTNIAAGTITASNIAANTITASQIAATTITAAQIAAGTITTTQIAASTITASNMNVSTLSSISANIGTVTAGTIGAAVVYAGQINAAQINAGTLTAFTIMSASTTGSSGAGYELTSGNSGGITTYNSNSQLVMTIQGSSTVSGISISNNIYSGSPQFPSIGANYYASAAQSTPGFRSSGNTAGQYAFQADTGGLKIVDTSPITMGGGNITGIGGNITSTSSTLFITAGTNVTFVANILPNADNTYTAGSSSFRFSVVYSAGGVVTTSDLTMKKILGPEKLGLDFIDSLNPVMYRLKSGGGVRHGLIAQELLTSLGDVEFAGLDMPSKGPWGINYSELIGPMILAIQELRAEVRRLRDG